MPEPEPDLEAKERMVTAFRQATNYGGEVGHFAFDDTPRVQTLLGRLVLEGPKRATAGPASMEEGPPVGNHDVVLDGQGTPLCIIRTDEQRTLPFRERDPAFAWDEGEGGRTLEEWTRDHLDYFGRHDADFGEDSLVNFERFSVVWPELDPFPPVLEEGKLTVRAVRPDDRDWVRQVTGDTTSEDGWPTDRCPGLLCRRELTTVGVLVFVPSNDRTEVVATSILTDVEGVEDILRSALSRLRDEYGWGPIED